MRVLYVEDDTVLAEEVGLMLQGRVRDFDTTPLGQIGFELAEHKDYDILLIDLMLPDIDGYEVVRRLRSAGVKTPYLILSGLEDRDSELCALGIDVGDYLAKPFTQSELIESMETVVARSHLAGQRDLDDIPPEPDSSPGDSAEYRKHQRFSTIKSARIDFGPGIDCKIWNQSHSGAALRLPDAQAELPPSFYLQLEYGVSHLCRVCWRNGDEVGVKFIEKPE